MIRNALVALALVGLVGASSASAIGISVGVKGGVNLAKEKAATSSSDQVIKDFMKAVNDSTHIRVAPAVGAEVTIGGIVGATVGLYYSGKGVKINSSSTSIDPITSLPISVKETNIQKLSYLEVPVLLNIAPPVPLISPSIVVGLTSGFLVGAKETDQVAGKSDTTYSIMKDDSSNSNFNTFDLGLTFGAGVGIKAGPGKITLDVRYTLGLLNTISKDSQDYYVTPGDISAKNRAFTILAGYTIGLGK